MTERQKSGGASVPQSIPLASLYNPVMRNGFPQGNENGCGYRYPHTVEEAEADLRCKILFFAALSHLSGEAFTLTVEHILDLRQTYFTAEKDGERDWSKPPAPHEIARLAEPEIRYQYAHTNHFGTDSLARKSGGQEGVPVYRRAAREADAAKRRADVEKLLSPYDPAIREEERLSPRAIEERFETPRFLRSPQVTVRGWVASCTVQTARIAIDPAFAEKLLSGREKFWIQSMERHAFLDGVAREMDETPALSAGPARLILTGEGFGFGKYLADRKGSLRVIYDPKESPGEPSPTVPWSFKAYGMSSLPEPKLRMFFLASLLSRVGALTGKDGGKRLRIGGIDLSKALADGKPCAELLLLPLPDKGDPA